MLIILGQLNSKEQAQSQYPSVAVLRGERGLMSLKDYSLGCIPPLVGTTSVTLTGPTAPLPAGSEMTLSCSSVGGLPHPILTISKVGGSTSLASGSSPQTATYNPAETDDQAEFECRATNKVGSLRDSIVISVTGAILFSSGVL